MIKKIIGGIALVILIAIAVFNSILNNPKDNSNLYSSLTLANIVALAEESESAGLDTKYVRKPFNCEITGNGKIKLVGGTIVEVKGSLSFSGGLVCESGGKATCTPTECASLWQWIFN
jgi:hypothetical protein